MGARPCEYLIPNRGHPDSFNFRHTLTSRRFHDVMFSRTFLSVSLLLDIELVFFSCSYSLKIRTIIYTFVLLI